MTKLRLLLLCAFLLALIPSNSTVAQQGELRVLTVDFMTDPLAELVPMYEEEYGVGLDLVAVPPEEFREALAVGYESGEFADLIIGPPTIVGDFVMENELVEGFIPRNCLLIDPPPDWCFPDRVTEIEWECLLFPDRCLPEFGPPDICDMFPELCPEPLDICKRYPWLCPVPPPCPFCPPCLSCPDPPIVWDIEFILVQEELGLDDPIPVDDFFSLLEEVDVAFYMENGVGFELEPSLVVNYDFEPPNFVGDNYEEAGVVFTVACNYVENAEMYSELGLVPLQVEDYRPQSFEIQAYVVSEELSSSGQPVLAATIADDLLNNPDVQQALYETTGLLPSNPDVLLEVLDAQIP